MTNAEKLAKIDALLSTIPSFDCKPGCADCCGPFDLSRLEFYRCVKASGRTVESIRLQIEKNARQNILSCPLLDKKTNRCSIYAVRPAICRVFGTTKESRCPHGYAPENLLDDAKARELLALVNELGA